MGYYYHRFSDESLNKFYELLENVTPLKVDCGALCGASCCKGSDSDGMLLFPGEEALFKNKEGYAVHFHTEYGCDCVVCSGSCLRDERPLSCRIYPYAFYANDEGKVTVAPDVRALGNCPLANQDRTVSSGFLRSMRLCAKVIEQDPALFSFVRRLTELFVDFGSLA